MKSHRELVFLTMSTNILLVYASVPFAFPCPLRRHNTTDNRTRFMIVIYILCRKMASFQSHIHWETNSMPPFLYYSQQTHRKTTNDRFSGYHMSELFCNNFEVVSNTGMQQTHPRINCYRNNPEPDQTTRTSP
jgi:hypothetical protein